MRRRRFLDHFGERADKLKEYIKEQDIDLKEEEGLIHFIRYYNEHYGNSPGQAQ